MAEAVMEKVTRDQVVTYLNTGTKSSPVWSLLGVGVTEYGLSYNPQVTTEKFIIDKNATSSIDSYQIQGSVSQKIYKGDPCFEFVNNLRRKASVGAANETEILDIDTYDKTSASGAASYKATKSNVTIAINTYMSDEAVIEYDIYYNGDPVLGSATIADKVPTFTPEVA